MSHYYKYHDHHDEEHSHCARSHRYEHRHKGCCSTPECDCGEEYHHSGRGGCCDIPKIVRRYISPEERKEALVKYIDELKKELAGAQAELEKL